MVSDGIGRQGALHGFRPRLGGTVLIPGHLLFLSAGAAEFIAAMPAATHIYVEAPC